MDIAIYAYLTIGLAWSVFSAIKAVQMLKTGVVWNDPTATKKEIEQGKETLKKIISAEKTLGPAVTSFLALIAILATSVLGIVWPYLAVKAYLIKSGRM